MNTPDHAVTFFYPHNPAKPVVAHCVCGLVLSDPDRGAVEAAWAEHSRAAREAAA